MEKPDLTEALHNIAIHLKNLGWGNADSTKKGAIEDLSERIEDAGNTIAEALIQVAEAVSDLAEAVEKSSMIS